MEARERFRPPSPSAVPRLLHSVLRHSFARRVVRSASCRIPCFAMLATVMQRGRHRSHRTLTTSRDRAATASGRQTTTARSWPTRTGAMPRARGWRPRYRVAAINRAGVVPRTRHGELPPTQALAAASARSRGPRDGWHQRSQSNGAHPVTGRLYTPPRRREGRLDLPRQRHPLRIPAGTMVADAATRAREAAFGSGSGRGGCEPGTVRGAGRAYT